MSSLSNSSSASSATATSSSLFPPLPTGCADLSGVSWSGSFSAGCVANGAAVLQTCCSQAGGTVGFQNDTCGCPFNSVFTPQDNSTFLQCVTAQNGLGVCISHSAATSIARPRWNPVLIVLGVSLLVAAVGA
ncbi:hypothetical protein MSAN_01572500 [Mycena sanguinolenta]|uniref:Uncharacterized protein n=1 Tax=Mycena sanguinolenta TaxID=230812 RepID=A0A8H6Y2F0_9AGAR|nr:hypothetical protein MSAN_01572500 [Mycena sanguinolenta]